MTLARWTIDMLMQRFPQIKWREPLPVAWAPAGRSDAAYAHGGHTFACRVCIANEGLNRRSPWQWGSEAEALAHIHKVHP